MIAIKCLKAVALAMLIVQPLCGCALEKGAAGGGAGDGAGEDSRIAADVQTLIQQRPDLGPPNLIQVDVRDHVVYLSGSANTELTVENAEALAHRPPGVTRVVSSIGVDN